MLVADVTYDFLDGSLAPGKGGATARVHAALRQAIVSLELKPGEILDKPAIAARLGVSRFPVGEALNRLASEGLVDIVPQSASRVALVRIADARENMFVRRAIEIEAIRTLTKTWSADRVYDMAQNLRYQEAAVASGDREGFYRFDVQFHAIILDGLGFERVKQAAETARLGLERVRRMLNSRRRQELTLDEHRQIVEALRRRDTQAAARAMESHLAAVMTELEAFAGERPELFADLISSGDRKA
ncbi:MAG: GntR family transcriptional regulator [Rhizobiales bacterium]|nr:GntR family transcriptional regulator [Hyphomicrobiales bacterium]MBI3673026.1 GntR family transcriptional regulator [Hyphomicrobiales bacterium]